MRFLSKIVLVAFALFFASCSTYKVGAIKSPGFKTIFVENFKSDVDEPALESLITTTLIQEFQRDGTLRMESPEKADVILRGKITQFELSPVRYSRANELTPTEAQLSLGITYSLTKKGQKNPYLDKQVATGAANFFIGNDLQSDKRQGISIAAEKMSKVLVSNLVEGW